MIHKLLENAADTLRQRSGMGFQVSGGLVGAPTSLRLTSMLRTSSTSMAHIRWACLQILVCTLHVLQVQGFLKHHLQTSAFACSEMKALLLGSCKSQDLKVAQDMPSSDTRDRTGLPCILCSPAYWCSYYSTTTSSCSKASVHAAPEMPHGVM